MRGKLHLASTHDLFSTWNATHEGAFGVDYKKHVDDFTIILKNDHYCCACGKLMKKGDHAHQALVSWGGRMSEGALRPHHMEPCIPTFEFTFHHKDGCMYFLPLP